MLDALIIVVILTILAILHGAVSTWAEIGLSETDAHLGTRGNF